MFEHQPHAPLHWIKGEGYYIVTAGTYLKEKFFAADDQLEYLQETFFELAAKHKIDVRSWSFFPNHYHAVLRSDARLPSLIRQFHSMTAVDANRRDKTLGRRVWYQYWDTFLADERAYLSRLDYVNQNPVHHEIVKVASSYKWCSAAWLEANAKRSLLQTLRQFDERLISLPDHF